MGLKSEALKSRGILESFAINALLSCLLGQRRLIFFLNVLLLKFSDLRELSVHGSQCV